MQIKELKTVKGLGTAILVLSIISIVLCVLLCLAAEPLAKMAVASGGRASVQAEDLSALGITGDVVVNSSLAQPYVSTCKLVIWVCAIWSLICSIFTMVAGLKARKVVENPHAVGSARNWGIVSIVFSVLSSDWIVLILSIILVVKASTAKRKLAESPAAPYAPAPPVV